MARTTLFLTLQRALRQALGRDITIHAASAEVVSRRRTFLQLSLTAAALGTAPALSGCGDDEPAAAEVVAIVGGGMAGIHCAYRLKEAGIVATVYEATGRAGGRMYSVEGQFAEAPSQLCELGGEFIDSGHSTLRELAVQLNLQLDDRSEPAAIEPDTYWVNGVVVDPAVIQQQFNEVAPLFQQALEAADDPDDFTAFDMLDATSLDQWLKDNVPVAQYPELHTVLQVAYRGEYGLENDKQSALNLIYLIGADEPDPFRIFGVSDERYHTHLGNSSFPTLLAAQLDTAQLKLEHKLVAARDAAGGFELDFETPSGTVTVACGRIVFALPFSVLRDADLSALSLSEDKRTIIDELAYGTNAKIMAGFSSRAWRQSPNSANGSLLTDLPGQQTWETTIGQDGAHGILTNYLGGDQGVASGSGSEAAWIEAVLPDIEVVWPGVSAAFTGTAVRMHWPTVPTTKGSYTCYLPGQWAFYGLEGEREGNIHFCGEHTSLDYQGYMEGAAETGALAAAEIIEDYALAKPQGLVDVLGTKLVVPQSVYRPGRFGRLNPFQRRRLRHKILNDLAARADHKGQ